MAPNSPLHALRVCCEQRMQRNVYPVRFLDGQWFLVLCKDFISLTALTNLPRLTGTAPKTIERSQPSFTKKGASSCAVSNVVAHSFQQNKFLTLGK